MRQGLKVTVLKKRGTRVSIHLAISNAKMIVDQEEFDERVANGTYQLAKN